MVLFALRFRLQSGHIGSWIKSMNASNIWGRCCEWTYCKALVSNIQVRRSVPLWWTSQWTTTGWSPAGSYWFLWWNRFHLHCLGKTYKLSKWVLHMLLEVHKRQQVVACTSLLSCHCTASIFNQVLNRDKKWVLHDTPKHTKHWLSRQVTALTRPPMHPWKIMLCV